MSCEPSTAGACARVKLDKLIGTRAECLRRSGAQTKIVRAVAASVAPAPPSATATGGVSPPLGTLLILIGMFKLQVSSHRVERDLCCLFAAILIASFMTPWNSSPTSLSVSPKTLVDF